MWKYNTGVKQLIFAPMAKFDHDTIVPYKESQLTKKEQVADMFDDIAGRYDFLNRFLSAGIDVSWRKKALNFLKPLSPKLMLDVATGTGDFAIMAAKQLKPQTIEGIDISEGMLQVGREKVKKEKLENTITLSKGDSENINFPANTFDAATVAFGVRNFQNLEQGLADILRVLKPGGCLVVLEFSKPKTPVFKSFYELYMKKVTPYMGKLFSNNKEAYSYLDESIKKFPEGQNFTKIMDSVGYQNIQFKTYTFGICTMYFGQK